MADPATVCIGISTDEVERLNTRKRENLAELVEYGPAMLDNLEQCELVCLDDLEAWEPALCEDPFLYPQLVRIRAAVRSMAKGAVPPVA